MAKMKTGNLGGIQRHNQRETENHSNKDIDVTRSYLNYDLVNPTNISYQKRVKEIIDSQRASTRAVRKDAVLVNEWIITSDKEFFETADTKAFFEDSLAYFRNRCGAQNIAYATVHLDESTPHMHLGIVPMIERRLSSKQLFTRETLKEIQDDLPAYLQAQGHTIERGLKGSEQKHLTVEEYKVNQREIQRMTQTVTELEKHAGQLTQEIQSEQEQLDTTAQILWYHDWTMTKQNFLDFSMTTEVTDPITKKTKTIEVDETTPQKYQFDFQAVFKLFQEKYEQLKRYITKLKHSLRQQANRLARQEENLKNHEEKLEDLTQQIKIRHQENERLSTLINAKTSYLEGIEKAADRTNIMPDYVKPSRLNKNMLLIPKDKWQAHYYLVNSETSAFELSKSLYDLEEKLTVQRNYDYQTYAWKKEIHELKQEKNKLQKTNTRVINELVRLYNEGKISMDDLRNPLSQQEQQALGIEIVEPYSFEQPTMEKEYEGPTMGL